MRSLNFGMNVEPTDFQKRRWCCVVREKLERVKKFDERLKRKQDEQRTRQRKEEEEEEKFRPLGMLGLIGVAILSSISTRFSWIYSIPEAPPYLSLWSPTLSRSEVFKFCTNEVLGHHDRVVEMCSTKVCINRKVKIWRMSVAWDLGISIGVVEFVGRSVKNARPRVGNGLAIRYIKTLPSLVRLTELSGTIASLQLCSIYGSTSFILGR